MIYNMKVCIKLLFILKSVHYIISNGVLKHPFVSKFYTVHVFSCIPMAHDIFVEHDKVYDIVHGDIITVCYHVHFRYVLHHR